jgi:hypothetical protein
MVWSGARKGRIVTHAMRAPVRPATRGMRVVSMASARVMAGKMVVSRRVSLDFPTPKWIEEEDVVIRTPASCSALPAGHEVVAAVVSLMAASGMGAAS